MSNITDAGSAIFVGAFMMFAAVVMFTMSVPGTFGTALALWLFVGGTAVAVIGPVWYMVAKPLARYGRRRYVADERERGGER